MARPARPCLHCGRLVRGATYCPDCQRARWAEQGKQRAPRPWYSGDWRRVRAAHLRTHPACENCGATSGLEVDHVIPRSLAGGLMTLCAPCHHAKTARDQTQAKRQAS